MDSVHNLNYRIIECTSEDLEFPVSELLKGTESNGWQSLRFCQYPQEIIFQFIYPVNLTQIKILCHEKKIPSLIEFYSYLPQSETSNYNPSNGFEKIGYIRFDSNKKNNYKSREFRRVFVNTNCMYLKLVMDKNYVNRYNIFNQIMLISIEFLGNPFENLNELKEKEEQELKQTEEKELDEYIDEMCKEKIKLMQILREDAVKKEEFDEARNIQGKIDNIRVIGKKIYDYELKKKLAIQNEDFSNAKLCKIEIENLRSKIRNLDKQLVNIKPVRLIINTEYDDNGENLKNNSNNSIFEESKLNNEDSNIPFEDRIVPTLRKNKNETDEVMLNISFKGELDEIDPQIKNTFDIFTEFINEEGLKKIFSKNILYKEEGIDLFIKKMDDIFSKDHHENIDSYINQTMKMIYMLLCERHPEANVKSLEIFEVLIHKIKELNDQLNLNYDLDITNNILGKLKEKVGDINSKVRKKTNDIYIHLLSQEFCDYNNLLNELIEDDIKEEFKQVVKSQIMIMGKLSILNRILDKYEVAINDKLTTENTFPYSNFLKFATTFITHSKTEIRKLSRSLLKKLYLRFGYHKMQAQIETIEERELEKLKFPEIEEFLKKKKIERKIINFRNKSSRDKSHEKNKERIKALSSSFDQKYKEYFCPKCHIENKRFKMEQYLNEHFNGQCVFYCHCPLCSKLSEIRKLNIHLTTQCEKRENMKICKRCKEPQYFSTYNKHVKANKCNPAKNPISAQRCPLCHEDIEPSEKEWFKHIVNEKCPKNKRKIDSKTVNEEIY